MPPAMHRLSILSQASQADLVLLPYPHLVVRNALAPDVYAELEASFPAEDIVLDGRRKLDTWFDYPACKAVANAEIAPIWREFMAHHTSSAFFQELLQVAGPALRQLHPDLERRLGKPLEHAVVGRRPGGRDNPLAPGADVSMESQFYLNYSRQPRVVRGPHVDRPSELFAALLYFRRADDPSTGGCLEVCEAKSPDLYDGRRGVRISTLPAEIDDDLVTTVKVVDYQPNTLVLFLNSNQSVHAVSPRSPTEVPRRHINFCCDLNFDLFDFDLPLRLAAKRQLEKLPLGWRLAKHL